MSPNAFGAPEAELIEGKFVADGKELAAFGEMARDYVEQNGKLVAIARYASPPGVEWDDEIHIQAMLILSIRGEPRWPKSKSTWTPLKSLY